MAFKQPCFIRKNTKEIREELGKLGYKFKVYASKRQCIATATSWLEDIIDNGISLTYITTMHPTAAIICEDSFDSNDPHVSWNCIGRIDCGTNEEMFLALAALRDDSDLHQWMIVTDTKGTHWTKSTGDKFMGDAAHSIWRKATVEDIVKHWG